MRKIILLLVGILLVIELSLRLLGNIYWLAYTAKPNRNDKDKVRILCIGESTTFGVGGGISDDYPSQLGQILDAKYPNKFSVYNRGVPGITSSLILLNLKRFLAETNPNLVILLCASNDSSYRLNVTNSLLILKDKNNFISTVFFKLSHILWNFRIYKLLGLLNDHISYRFREFCGAYINVGRDFESTDYRYYKVFEGKDAELRREQYAFNIRKITRYIRSKGAEIIYTTYLHSTTLDLIKEVSRENDVILCNQVEMLNNKNIPLASILSGDGFHPNAKGYNLMALFLLKTLEDNDFI